MTLGFFSILKLENPYHQLELENQQLATTVDELRLAVKNQRDEMDSMQMKLGLTKFLKLQ